MRIDAYIASQGLMGRDRAKEVIHSGRVTVDGVTVTKPSQEISETAVVEIRDISEEYVSRGGKKLEKALKVFDIDVSGKTALDVGASTGGFTDCLLRNGASRVCALDSGSNQLCDRLRTDERVVSLEKTNIKDVTGETLPFLPQIIVVDVSFISLTAVFPPLSMIADEDTDLVCLVKPQFECGRSALNKKGVVKDKKNHILALNTVVNSAKEYGFSLLDLTYSPIKGPEGNIEFLAHFRKCGTTDIVTDKIKLAVSNAHEEL